MFTHLTEKGGGGTYISQAPKGDVGIACLTAALALEQGDRRSALWTRDESLGQRGHLRGMAECAVTRDQVAPAHDCPSPHAPSPRQPLKCRHSPGSNGAEIYWNHTQLPIFA